MTRRFVQKSKEKTACQLIRGSDCLQTGCFRLHNMYAGVARSTLRLPGRRWPTSKLCLLLRVMVPITPMGDAHLLFYLYHSEKAMSRFFCKNYLYFLMFCSRKMVVSTDIVLKSIIIPYLASFRPNISRCCFCRNVIYITVFLWEHLQKLSIGNCRAPHTRRAKPAAELIPANILRNCVQITLHNFNFLL